MEEFYSSLEETNQLSEDKSGIFWGVISSPWTWIIVIVLVGLLAWRKWRKYF